MMKITGHIIILWLMILGLICMAPLPARGEMNTSPRIGLAWEAMLADQSAPESDASPHTLKENPSEQLSTIGPATKRHFGTFAIGAVYWPNLGKIDPSQAGFDPQQFGQFKEWGFNLEIAYHYLATAWLDRDLWIGLDFGLFYNENKGKVTAIVLPSGSVFTGEIGSRGLYLTPSLKWFVLGQRGSTRLYLGAGAGYYLLDFAELFRWGEGGELYEDSTLGGYLSVGVRFPFSDSQSDSAAVVLETKVHFADFGEFAPDTGQIKGPIYMFQLGLSF